MTATQSTIELDITGLTCGHCVQSVTEELAEVAGIGNIEVELVKGGISKAKANASAAVTDEALRDAVAEAGYELVNIRRS